MLSQIEACATLEGAAAAILIARDALEEGRINSQVIAESLYTVETALRSLADKIGNADGLTD